MMYDTLLQMGRWFGYRPGYEDLCRVWMPEEAEGWYTHVAEFLARTWRWHRLLQGSRDGRLGDEEQKGLIGELVVLERRLLRLLPVLRALDAVRSWTGPLDTPRDFEISRIHVEAKARGRTAGAVHQQRFPRQAAAVARGGRPDMMRPVEVQAVTSPLGDWSGVRSGAGPW